MFSKVSEEEQVRLRDPVALQLFLKEKLSEEALPEVPPPTGGIMGALFDERLRGKPCHHCQSSHEEEEMLVCDKCEATWHDACAKEVGTVIHDGPWFCNLCRGKLAMEGFSDVMEDYPLLDYLFLGQLPEDLDE